MSDISIRAMTEADLPAIRPLLAQLGYELDMAAVHRRFAAVSAAADHALFVAESEGAVVGFLHLFARAALEKPPEVVVQSIAVDAAARRGGIGRRLMQFAEGWARDNGFASVALATQTRRADAHAFYERLGYGIAATSHLMRKDLGDPEG